MGLSEALSWYLVPRPLFRGGHQVELLRGGDQLFPAMIRAIERARHEVWLATYIVHDDEATRAVERALAQAARRGVRVRLVIDGFGSHDSLDLIEPRLRAAGVAVAVFRPLSAASFTRARPASTASMAVMTALRTPVWPTMSPFG